MKNRLSSQGFVLRILGLLFLSFLLVITLILKTSDRTDTVMYQDVPVNKELFNNEGAALKTCVSNFKINDQLKAKWVGHRLYWNPGEIIRIGFIGGTDVEKKFVQETVEEAFGKYNLYFEWGAWLSKSDVRISFVPSWGAYSWPGTYARERPKGAETMNLGWLDKAVVLHEFAHMIWGFHSHSHGTDRMNWNKPVIYAALSRPPNNWDKANIDHNVFKLYGPEEADLSAKRDDKSILKYGFDCTWVTDGIGCNDWNTSLSAMDDEFLTMTYGLKTVIKDSVIISTCPDKTTPMLCSLLQGCNVYKLFPAQMMTILISLDEPVTPSDRTNQMAKKITAAMDARGCKTCNY